MFATRLVRRRAGRHAGAADDQRDAHRRLVHEHLPGRNAVLAVEEPVVGGEHDQRSVHLAGSVEGGDDVADRLVDGKQRLQALLVVLTDAVHARGADEGAVADARRLVRDVRLVERGRGRQRLRRETIPVPRRRNRRGLIRGIAGLARPAAVRREEPDREEERLRRGRMPANQLDGLPPVDVRLVVRSAGPVGHEPAVLVQPVVVEAVGGRVGRAVPLRPARRDLRRPCAAVAVQVLADVDGVVAGRPQPRRQRVRVRRRELLVAAGGRRVPHDRVVVAVLARDVGRPATGSRAGTTRSCS